MRLTEIDVRPVIKSEKDRFKTLMQNHHYLGFVPKIGETAWYVACYKEEWVSLLGFSVSVLKSAVRDKWIGWDPWGKKSKITVKPCFYRIYRDLLTNILSIALSSGSIVVFEDSSKP